MSNGVGQSPLKIVVLDGNKVLGEAVLEHTRIIVGRILSADFKLADARISRIHALIERLEDGTLRLTDMASTHGTFVNGERIIEKIVSPSDDIRFASLIVQLSFAPLSVRPPEQTIDSIKSATPLEIQVGARGEAHAVYQPKEATGIQSLKSTARTRGVLERTGATVDLELTVYWEETVLAIDHYAKEQRSISIGALPGNDYIVSDGILPGKFEFLTIRGQSVELHLNAQMQGSVRLQGRMHTVAELIASKKKPLVMSGQDIAKIKVGRVNFFLMFVPEPPEMPRSKILDLGPLYWGAQMSVLAIVALLFGASLFYRVPIEGRVTEFPEKLRRILIEEYKKDLVKIEQEVEVEDPVEVPKTTAVGDQAGKSQKVPDAQLVSDTAHRGGNEGEGQRERGKEGKRGLPDAKNQTGITNRPKVAGATKTFDGPKKAKVPDRPPGEVSLLGSLRNSGLGAKLSQVAGGGGAQGNDPLSVALSGVGGGGLQNGRGSGGSGLQGTGTGGGGKAVGVGGLGTKGFGGGAKGSGLGSIPGKGQYAVGTETLDVTVLGSLTREEIERVVNAHRNEVYFCYQRELQRDPALAGRMSYRWVIGSGGRVISVKSTANSTGSASLASCVRDKIQQWIFPTPTGNSQAEVDWPWTFKPQGA